MKIAIASSGLGHISRGIETWALDTAEALVRQGADVTLFAAAEVDTGAPLKVLQCLQRRTALNSLIIKLMPSFTWRSGFKSGYGLEQFTFSRRLLPELRRGNYDILHIQDPLLAEFCRKARCAGKLRTQEILAHGTEEPPDFLAKFSCLQHLAPWHLEQTLKSLSADAADYPGWVALPNFVDIDRYRPAEDRDEKRRLRRQHGIAENSRVFGTAAAVKKGHKRIDYLIREFAAVAAAQEDARLIIAGSEQPDTAELRQLAERLCPGKIHFFINHPHNRMPELLRCMDLFVLTSIFEMMPIALLEALACGLPTVTNRHPVMTWMAGEASINVDMSRDGALSERLAGLTADEVIRKSQAARRQAVEQFSTPVVIRQYLDYYDKIAMPPRHS